MNPMYFRDFSGENLALLLVILVWSLFWKGFALWTAAHRREKGWFLAILILNTVGVLEIIYLFGFAKKKWSDVTALFRRHTSSFSGNGDQNEPSN